MSDSTKKSLLDTVVLSEEFWREHLVVGMRAGVIRDGADIEWVPQGEVASLANAVIDPANKGGRRKGRKEVKRRLHEV